MFISTYQFDINSIICYSFKNLFKNRGVSKFEFASIFIDDDSYTGEKNINIVHYLFS